jgi:hypothetical protein
VRDGRVPVVGVVGGPAELLDRELSGTIADLSVSGEIQANRGREGGGRDFVAKIPMVFLQRIH